MNVTNQSGPASAFNVSAALVDPDGVEFARGAVSTEAIAPGATQPAEVLIRAEGEVSGSCEVLEVVTA